MKQNNQIQTVVRLKFWYVCINHPINNLNVKLGDDIHGNDISTYGVAVMANFNHFSVVIATHLKTEIIVLSEKQFLNNENIAVSSRTYY